MKFWLTTRSSPEVHNVTNKTHPQQHQNAIPLHLLYNDTTNFKHDHLHTITNHSHTDSLSSTQTVPPIPPKSSTLTKQALILPGQKRGMARVKGQSYMGTCPTRHQEGPQAKHCFRKLPAMPNLRNKDYINTHTHTHTHIHTHRLPGMPTVKLV